jgi:cyclohexyl-isocyanide hydratase
VITSIRKKMRAEQWPVFIHEDNPMTRRALTELLTLAAALPAAADNTANQNQPPEGYKIVDMGGLRHYMPATPEQIVMLIYPGMTALDLIGPQQTFGYMMGAKVTLAWKTLEPVVTDTGVKLVPTAKLGDILGPVDLIFVPGGGRGTIALMSDAEVLQFLADQASKAKYVTSVCTGSLVLGAAGLLRGYRATSHWAVRDVLPALGAIPTAGRFVEDRNRITAGGVTAGIDFGLYLVSKLRGPDYGQALELMLEYDPQPPFHSGSPALARPDIREVATRMYAPLVAQAKESAAVARSRWGNP